MSQEDRDLFQATMSQMMANTAKLTAEQAKMLAEQTKMQTENRWYPFAIGSGVTLAIVAVVKLFL